MRVRLLLAWGLIALVAVVGSQASGGTAGKKPTPPTVKDLTGVWIGFDSDELTFTRLDLRPDMTGFCARVSPADTVLHQKGVHVYRVTKWSVKGWDIRIESSPMSNATGVKDIKGRVGLASLALEISGPENGGWNEKLSLHPESRIQASDQETKDAIENLERR